MILFLLTLAWIAQGVPITPAATGAVTGTLKTELGTPAVGVRVAAMARPETAADVSYATALTSISETDVQGHFRLENIPPGRYLITAGRVDYPTYFPGTQDVTAGRVIAVKSGDIVTGVEFALNSIAVRPPDSGIGIGISAAPLIGIPVHVIVEGGGGVPVFSAAGFPTLRLSRTTDGLTTAIPLATPSVSIAIPNPTVSPEYRIALDYLPEGYSVSSIQYGTTLITDKTLRLSTSGFPATAAVGTVFSMATGSIQSATLFAAIPPLPLPATPVAASALPALTIMLAANPIPASGGVRVTGNARNTEIRSIYISGVPGLFFSDGSFEFRNVPPGRHTIATADNPSSSRPQGLSIVVGNQDIAGIVLIETPMLPSNVRSPVPPGPAGNHAPGTIIPPASIRGRVLDEISREPIGSGTVFLTGHYGSSYPVDGDGRFEIPRLLPGSYEMEIQTFDHSRILRTIVVDEDDLNLELTTMPL